METWEKGDGTHDASRGVPDCAENQQALQSGVLPGWVPDREWSAAILLDEKGFELVLQEREVCKICGIEVDLAGDFVRRMHRENRCAEIQNFHS